MRTILLTLTICLLATGVMADTLYTVNIGSTSVHVQVVEQLNDSAMLANGWQRRENLYLAKIIRLDSSTVWISCGEDCYIFEPTNYDLVAVIQRYDVDGSGVNDISDLLAIVDYMFPQGGE